MDSGASLDQSNECRDLSPKISAILVKISNEEAVNLLSAADGAASLGPITPVPKREIVDVPFDFDSSLTEAERHSKVPCFALETSRKEDQIASVDDSRPRTPKEVVFDPFAPGPDSMAMAPLCKNYVDQIRISVARRLNFESSLKLMKDDMESISDEEMFESVYNNLLDAIVSKQTESILAEISNGKWDSNWCKTPPEPHRNGIAETCPAAPIKPSSKARKIDFGLCRKLDF